MEGLFRDYHALLGNKDLTRVMEENPKLVISHIVSSVRPATTKERLQADLSFSQHALRKDFRTLVKHAVKLSRAFQHVDAAPRSKRRQKNEKGTRCRVNGSDEDKTANANTDIQLCLWEPHGLKSISHYIKD